jgi:hypothetical protein
MLAAAALAAAAIAAARLFFENTGNAEDGGFAPGANMAYSTFIEEKSHFTNPERGWYTILKTTGDLSLEALAEYRKERRSVIVLLEADLGAYMDRPLDGAKLSEIQAAFLSIREAGDTAIFRAAYDGFKGVSQPEPRDLGTILGHIAQLRGIFYENEDILYSVQAGFLGPWGEWHDSYYGSPPAAEVQLAVANALLDAVPPSVSVALRRPSYIREISGARPLSAGEAFSGSAKARLALHNDALLSDETDMGTYSGKGHTREKEVQWISSHALYTPFVGESNQKSLYSRAKTGIPLMRQMHLQALNPEYEESVIEDWKRSTYQSMNAFDYIEMSLGYRFVLKQAGFSTGTEPGGILRVELRFENTGFGSLMKEKKLELVLSNGAGELRAKLADDPRFWSPGTGPILKEYSVRMPADMAPGAWAVSLSLASAFETLKGNPAHSVRFANEGVWNPATGLNELGTVTIGSNAGVSVP